MNKIKIWHNPRCTKSREAVSLLEENGCEPEIVKYLDNKLTNEEMKSLLKMLDMSARELMRTAEAVYKELGLKDVPDEEALINAMVENPKLIQRPILIKGSKAIIGRPASVIAEFIK
ncbi:arsenate reductase (glutaredoxin) [Sulfurimonas sp.]|uniref:arsenate reductase (glutaredoxin) n=1 Tax=Sulfurimonas sp. TaxID=2022749 RepID=UPI002600F9B6|nr:arsenate reductase (glutaredoxin) [Sulfurimonas sp.]MBT5935878.1 arsenate reductase (glutaredoxin) [Sulfurimonas sp.]